jgi:hypothetical protein
MMASVDSVSDYRDTIPLQRDLVVFRGLLF